MTVSALEFQQLHPPRHVIAEFRDVQSAQIDVETKKREAEGFASREIPKAQAESNGLIQAAAAYQNTLKSWAIEEYSVFAQLFSEYQKNPDLVRNRIYLETLERICPFSRKDGRISGELAEDRSRIGLESPGHHGGTAEWAAVAV